MSFFETQTAMGANSSNLQIATEAVLISLISVLAKQSGDANKFIWEIENEVKSRLPNKSHEAPLAVAVEILSAVREKAIK